MSVFDILKRGGEAVKGSLPAMLVVSAFNMVSAIAMLAVIGLNPTPEKIAEVTGYMMMWFALMIVVWILIEGGLFAAILSVLKTGNAAMENFFSNCMKFFVRLLAINAAGGLITILLWVIGAFLVGIFVAFGGGNNIFFNILGGVILFVTFVCVVLVAIPILISQYFLVIDDSGIKESLGKGFDFLKKFFWKTLGFFALLAVLIFAVSFLVNFASTLLGNIVKGWAAAVISILVTSLMNGAIAVFSGASILTLIMSCMPKVEESTPAAE